MQLIAPCGNTGLAAYAKHRTRRAPYRPPQPPALPGVLLGLALTAGRSSTTVPPAEPGAEG